MSTKAMKIGWIGAGRMGFEMAKRLAIGEDADNGQHVVPAHDFSADTRDSVVAAPHSVVPAQAGTQEVSTNATGFPPLMKAFEGEIARERRGCDITVWNRTRAKAEPLAQYGAKIADHLHELAGCDVVFCMVSTWDDVKEVIAGPGGLLSRGDTPRIVVECSSISIEGSAELRATLAARGTQLLAAPVSGNAKVIKAGKLSFVCSGPRAVFDEVSPLLRLIAPAAAYVGEGELARIVKICHNVFLGVVTQSLAEITVLAQKAGVPRHAFLEFMNQSVMGSVFTRYKSPAFVNLDFKVTFTPYLLRKDLDLGLDAGRRYEVPMPLASMTRDLVQAMMGRGMTEEDFATLLVQQARASGVELEPENVPVSDGLG